jgi:undecaprenyl phosphate N,N'-diacetylbacillosamine 1-phosphate transferase
MSIYIYFKYAVDFVAATVLLVLASWILLLCVIMIKLDDPKAPVMYNSERIGKDCRPFKMYKFRTIKTKFSGIEVPAAFSFTTPGKILRKTSLDELPQLLNILKGEMSFIGPRPLIRQYIPWYTREQNSRHLVRPGLTGFSQINGRVNLPWDKRLEMDVEYVKNISFMNDVKILFMTFFAVFGGENTLVDDGSDYDRYFDAFQREQIEKGLVDASELVGASPVVLQADPA